ncbi:helix-turn-helix domain-containing protein [Streptomyces sp. NPDC005283]|uniref:RICIN domain-containing protein n=1 Tax=Streptomyces sp. NPDC005283 TaxID=3156871 RepID=UPI00345500DD
MDSAGHGAPDPEQAHSSAEFVARMQELKDWSGLTYRELTARAEAAGDVLPRSTVANMLSRSTVPREELVVAFVRACGCGPGATESWLRVRKELTRRERQAVEVPAYGTGGQEAGPGPEMAVPPEPARRSWRSRVRWPAVVALGATAVVAVTIAVLLPEDDKPTAERHTAVVAPARGPVQIRAVHSGLCLAERAGQRSGQLYQGPCAPDTVPRFALKPVAAWRIETDHRDFGLGCTGVAEKSTQVGAALVDQECGKRGPAEAFRLEAVGKPVRGYRLRPLHSDLCAGVQDASKERGARIVQQVCTKDARGQLFSFDPDAQASTL